MKTYLLLLALLMAGCSYPRIKPVMLNDFKGCIIVDKKDLWTSMNDLSSGWKVNISCGGKVTQLMITQFDYDRYSIGDTIR